MRLLLLLPLIALGVPSVGATSVGAPSVGATSVGATSVGATSVATVPGAPQPTAPQTTAGRERTRAGGSHGRWAWPLSPQPRVVRRFIPPSTAYGPGHRGLDLAGASPDGAGAVV